MRKCLVCLPALALACLSFFAPRVNATEPPTPVPAVDSWTVVAVSASDAVPRSILLNTQTGKCWTWTSMENQVDANGQHPQVGKWEPISETANGPSAGTAAETYHVMSVISADKNSRVIRVNSITGSAWTWTSMESKDEHGSKHPQVGKWERIPQL